MSTFQNDLHAYEKWLRTQCDVVEADLRAKHERMRESPSRFLRATYFRWATTIETLCPEFVDAPRVLCVGDIHVENFGTWRDAEGRLVWGVNDFDEAAVMPYAYDLIRLVASLRLARGGGDAARLAAAPVLEGYVSGLTQPVPVLVDTPSHPLATLSHPSAQHVREFWSELDECPTAHPPGKVERALRAALPEDAQVLRVASRRKGGGSLGRPRFVVTAHWQGGAIVREAKAVVPSAWAWAHGKHNPRTRVLELARGAGRSPDPTTSVAAGFQIRRIAPDSGKLEMKDPSSSVGADVLRLMGQELGSVHAAHKRGSEVVPDLLARHPGWLETAAEVAVQALRRDYRAFKGRAAAPG